MLTVKMKKVFALLAITSVMVACNSGDEKAAEAKTDTVAAVTAPVDTTAKVVVDTTAAKVDASVKK